MISTIAFALLLVALIVLVIVPSFLEIRLINQQVLEERTRLEALYTRGQVLKTVQQNYNTIKDDATFLNSIILKENQELSYITAIEGIASNLGVTLEITVSNPKRTPETRFSELGFTLALVGEWEQLARFLDHIEALPYYTNINEMTVAVRSDEKNKTSRTANITIAAITYWLIPSL